MKGELASSDEGGIGGYDVHDRWIGRLKNWPRGELVGIRRNRVDTGFIYALKYWYAYSSIWTSNDNYFEWITDSSSRWVWKFHQPQRTAITVDRIKIHEWRRIRPEARYLIGKPKWWIELQIMINSYQNNYMLVRINIMALRLQHFE